VAARRRPGIYDALDVPLVPAAGKLGPERPDVIIDVPDGKHPIMYVWGELVPGIGPAAAPSPRRSTTTPPWACASSRPPGSAWPRSTAACSARTGAPTGTARRCEDGFPDAVTDWRTTDALDDRARLAAEYAERWATDHHGLDDEFWDRMLAALHPAPRSWSCPCASARGSPSARPPQPRARASTWGPEGLSRGAMAVTTVLIGVIVVGSALAGRLDAEAMGAANLAVVAGFALLFAGIGVVATTAARRPRPDLTAITIETTVRNTNLGLLVRTSVFGSTAAASDPVADLALFTLLAYAGISIALTVPLILSGRRTGAAPATTRRPGLEGIGSP
jgi:hypothetical protein